MTKEHSTILLGVYGLSFRWTGERETLSEVSFELERGQCVALFGPNGSGKSTLMKLISGLLSDVTDSGAFQGQIRYLGQNFLERSPSERARTIAYIGSSIRAEFPMTAYQAVLLGRTSWHSFGWPLFGSRSKEDEKKVKWAMEKCFCWGFRDRDIGTLSGGELQLVALARALVQGARILFLDEALSKMDLHHQISVGRLLKGLVSEGFTIVLVSHDMNLALEWADSAILLNKGKKIAQGVPEKVLTQNTLRQVYGEAAEFYIGKNPKTHSMQIFRT